ncbi:MAG: aminopeptidase, partial [Paucimonas sp.]|nr:aminopeptidase [Paucimonas sp.]
MRAFAVTELGLPDNGTFHTYTDLKRPYVLWNVVAAPELSLKAKQWCFPIAGCVNYRGYYDKKSAQAFADELRKDGWDVQVAGVPAYSTLGWFNDPVLSTFIGYPEAELARLIFHELAHQVVYAPGDSQFNESFATAVEEAGVERWLAMHGDDDMRKLNAGHDSRERDFLRLLMKTRRDLEENYNGAASDEDKRAKKQAIFAEMKLEYRTLRAAWGDYPGFDRWFEQPLSNAHLAAIATYHDFVPGFRALLAREKTFPRFFKAAKILAEMEEEARHRALTELAQSAPQLTAQADGNGGNAATAP